ncbi:RNA helicase KNAG_0B06360 [Huiozyma naganishii CBS 8797]|uniref:RNA helicase n=1 Tax=Huiozyma naganishii (strain ATCC MYA-139 / BCRC 22969 / CBS 8797 / KCTC 17520 / NBRC 10181 / NCYC 3082 / Yp74L-3) TaxID=1071383 RepID=J7S439_HUIN7|nr:hypothetical protein KNAG_0B06360 [Kazachstania naganishii CBS 8797]CCK69064.1 hypothetical protein KNAG_0B06360 [Kazachstania naganishii CBS 8797]
MAKKGKKNGASPSPEVAPGKKGKKGSKSEEPAILTKEEQRAQQQAHRAKVTSTASWTGKLPHTLLHEFCVKKKWNKVEYDMRRHGDKGMVATAVLSWTDPKTKEVLKVKMNDPTFDRTTGTGLLLPQETAAEARHMAAVVALSRVAFNKNLQMMLPPNHKKLWYDLEDYRKLISKSDPRSCARLFDLEPFTSMVEEKKTREKAEEEFKAKQNQAEKTQQIPILITNASSSKPSSSSRRAGNDRNKPSDGQITKIVKPAKTRRSLVKFPRKVWERASFVDLEESTRQMIEATLKPVINWESEMYKETPEKHAERAELEVKLVGIGFRQIHVKEAMQFKDPLSFLLFNLPDDDLPPFFHKRKEDSKNKVEIASLPLSTRLVVERLTELGVSEDEAHYSLQEARMNENEAVAILMSEFVTVPPSSADHSTEISEEESLEMWRQELESLQCIDESKVEDIVTDLSYSVVLEGGLKLKARLYRTQGYPYKLPGIIVSTFDKKYKLPNYIKKQILSKLVNYLVEGNLIGDMLVYNIIEWLEDNIQNIIDNPGSLLSQNDLATSSHSDTIRGNHAKSVYNKKKNSRNVSLSPQQLDSLHTEYLNRQKTKQYKEMQEVRALLPAWKKQDEIVELIEQNDVVLITGETGSGKSTQVVQFILDALQNLKRSTKIICTQPRRISAIGLAERVADERCVTCGDEVGYTIRGVNMTKATTRIRFMTTGVLVRILQGDQSLLNDSIVVIDEVHERSIDTDLVVTLLKNLLGKVKGLKIVLMSATVNVDLFSKFFPQLGRCHIEGRTFPIKDYFLDDILEALDFKIKKNEKPQLYRYEDTDDLDNGSQGGDDGYIRPGPDSNFFKSGQINYDLLCQVALHVDQELKSGSNDGSIIIFLPGVAEIDKSCRMLKEMDTSHRFVVLPLHSALTPEDQKKVFRRYGSKRKIVVSTNIAETSITIDDCVATIDTGRAKTMYYNPRENTTRLIESFISKAEAKQRRGRAGRVRKGVSYKLFSKRLFEEDMVDMPAPEIKRVALESLYISVKAMGVKDVTSFLASGLESPPLQSLRKAERMLTTVGLLEEDDRSLTQLGRYISLMPVMDSKQGKLLIYSIIFGVTDLGVLTASILSSGSQMFIGGRDNRDAIKKVLLRYQARGDLLAMVEILRQYLSIEDKAAKRQFMRDNMLSYNKVSEILSARAQYYSILRDVGFLPMSYRPWNGSPTFNANESNSSVVEIILTGSFYPNVARVQLPDPKFLATSSGAIEKDPEAKTIKYWVRNEEYVDKLSELRQTQTASGSVDMDDMPLPSTRAFIHPSSVLFSDRNVNVEEIRALEGAAEEGAADKYASRNPMLKLPFLVYNSSHCTSKLFLNGITPTSTLSLLLFGGPISYDIHGEQHSPGIVVDDWLPVRTWCKNAVLIKRLRQQLDVSIREVLQRPRYDSRPSDARSDSDTATATSVIDLVVKIVGA